MEVAKEYPESTSQFYVPRCVALHRCGGCCTNEAFYCANTSHTLVNKTVSEAAGLSFVGLFFQTPLIRLFRTWIILLHYTTALVFSALTPQKCPRKQNQSPVSVCNNPPCCGGTNVMQDQAQGSSYINIYTSAEILLSSNTVP